MADPRTGVANPHNEPGKSYSARSNEVEQTNKNPHILILRGHRSLVKRHQKVKFEWQFE